MYEEIVENFQLSGGISDGISENNSNITEISFSSTINKTGVNFKEFGDFRSDHDLYDINLTNRWGSHYRLDMENNVATCLFSAASNAVKKRKGWLFHAIQVLFGSFACAQQLLRNSAEKP